MFFNQQKKEKQSKAIDGLKRKVNKSSKLSSGLNLDKINFQKAKKPLRVVLIVLSALVVIFLVLYLIPQTRAKIDLARMMWSGKYLVLFQNNAELRATGGFIGSFAVIDTRYGRVSNTYFDSNIYKRDNEFSRNFKVAAKDPILKDYISDDSLAMRDSNWALDYSEAAQQVAWFYEQEGGTNVDGVIAIDIDFFKNLLDVIGPISLAKYNTQISSDNFLEVVQTEVEETYYEDLSNSGVNEPKSILADMMSIIITRVKNIKNWGKLYKFVFEQLKKKHLLLYSYSPSIQSTIVENNWGGTIPSTNVDYLYINNSNLGANKSSIYVNEEIEVDIKTTNVALIHKLTYTRTYPDVDLSELEYFDPDNVDNINYTRILIPQESENIIVLENGNDMQDYKTISEEAEKTKVGLWSSVKKGSKSIYEITYEIPVNIIGDKYSFYLQKQPGAANQNVKVIIDDIVQYDVVFDRDLEIH